MAPGIRNVISTVLAIALTCVFAVPPASAESSAQGAPPAGPGQSMIERAVSALVDDGAISQEIADRITSYLQANRSQFDLGGSRPGGTAGRPGGNADSRLDWDSRLLGEMVSQGIITQGMADKIAAKMADLGQNSTNAPSTGPTASPSAATRIRVYIDGVEKKFTPAPIIRNGSTLIPMRAFFEALGCQVGWDQATRTATGTRGNTTIRLAIGNKTAHVNGQARSLAVEPQLIDGSTFIPLRFVSEALGATVNWDNGVITITTIGD